MSNFASVKRLKELFHYNLDTSSFVWKSEVVYPNTQGGKEAFQTVLPSGYRQTTIDGKVHYKHKVVYALHTGSWPDGEVDHVDGNTSNDHPTNLRQVTARENQRNRSKPSTNKSGHIGVSKYKRGGWVAYIHNDEGKQVNSYHRTLEAAVDWRGLMEVKLGYHDNHGRTADV